MELRQLEALVALDNHGTFSAAADELLTVQSNVSTRIANLERELGATLVDRNARMLTPEGRVIVKRARSILSSVAAMPSDLAELRDLITGEVHVGLIASTARWLVPHLLAFTRANLPDVELRITESASNTVASLVLTGELDMGVVNLPVDDPNLEAVALFDEQIMLVLPSNHRLAKRKVTIADLAGVDLFAPPVGASYRDGLEAAFRRNGLTMQVTNEFDGIRLIESLAAANIGAAFLPASATPNNHEPEPITVPGIDPRSVGIITASQRQQSAAARAVVAALSTIVAANVAAMRGISLPVLPKAAAEMLTNG